MTNLPFNITDIVFTTILLFSTILAFQKGALKEISTVIAWVGAGVFTLYTYTYFLPFVRDYIKTDTVATNLTVISVFLFALMVLHIVLQQINAAMTKTALSPINKSLGLIFGVARGLVIAAVVYISAGYLTNGKLPEDITTAKSRPIIDKTAVFLTSSLPENLEVYVEKALKKLSYAVKNTRSL